MKLSDDLLWRNLIKDKTFDDIAWLDEPKTFYLGVDVGSADSITVGNLAVLMLAKRLAAAGWNAVLLVGGATSLIGDPGGKKEERALVSREQVEHNKAAISAQISRLFEGITFTMVDNYDWFKDVGYLEFLREVGKHYSMTELVQRDYIAARIGSDGGGISYAEFSYSLIQGYDFWHLFKTHNVQLQIGGSDQWGNMLSGVPLIRKKESKDAHAMSMPLVINKSTGEKFGKSEGGAVWLDGAKTSPYKFYQFWLNVDDEAVEDYLKVYSERSQEEIEALIVRFRENRGQREAQKALAYDVTKLVHGEQQTDAVIRATEALFGADFLSLSDAEKDILCKELPVVNMQDTVETTLTAAGLASSNSEARRFIESGAISLNGSKIEVNASPNILDGLNLLKRGKNNFALVKK